jgi:hypothetical protein
VVDFCLVFAGKLFFYRFVHVSVFSLLSDLVERPGLRLLAEAGAPPLPELGKLQRDPIVELLELGKLDNTYGTWET